MPDAAAHAFVNALTLFGIGASWGGFESLAIPFDCTPFRTATRLSESDRAMLMGGACAKAYGWKPKK